MSILAQLAIALALLMTGFGGGVKYHAGVVAKRDLAAADLQKSDRIQQRKFSDVASGKQAATVATLSTQLGDARVQISKMSGRECLDADSVRVLNAIGAEPGGATASQPAGTPQAVATDRDVGTAIATCRAWYGQVSGQLNQILDIEDRRYPPAQ